MEILGWAALYLGFIFAATLSLAAGGALLLRMLFWIDHRDRDRWGP